MRGLKVDEDAPARLVQAHADAVKLAALDASNVRGLEQSTRGMPTIRVAELETDVHDVALLARLSAVHREELRRIGPQINLLLAQLTDEGEANWR